MERLWVARVHVSARTREKITSRHGLDVDEILANLVGVSGLLYTWHEHQEYGLRALVDVRLDAEKVLVVLFPTGTEDEYHLGSAYRVSRRSQ